MNNTNHIESSTDASSINIAQYRKETFELYAGNAYIEALPDLPEDGVLVKRLAVLPKFSAQEREMSSPHRLMALAKIRRIFVPTPRVVSLARAMQMTMFEGYAPRSPGSVSDRETDQRISSMVKSGGLSELAQRDLAAQLSMGLIGSSGQGKSFTLRHIAGTVKPYYFHEQTGKWQVPYLIIEMAFDGRSVNTLAASIVTELDRILPDAGYYKLVMEGRGRNAETRLAMALRLAYLHGVGMIVVDEGQNQMSTDGEDAFTQKRRAPKDAVRENSLTKLLITASNISHIPLLMAGTPEMFNTVGNRFTRSRRLAGNGSAVWGPLTRVDPGFEMLLKVLFRYQWVKTPIEYSSDWADFLHRMTGGIPDVMTKLWASSQRLAITSGVETLTHELVQAAMAAEFRPVILGIETVLNADQVPAALHSPDLLIPSQHVLDRCLSETTLPVEIERVLPDEAPPVKRAPRRRAVKEPSIPPAAALDPKVLQSADLRTATAVRTEQTADLG